MNASTTTKRAKGTGRRLPVLHHGTPNGQLTELKLGRAQLIFASVDPDYAAGYGKTILRVEMTLRNPADLENDPRARALAIENFNQANFRNVDDGFSDKFDPETDETWELAESPTFKSAMERAGYDGATFHETSGDGCITARTYVAFHPHQVRVLPGLAKASEEVARIVPMPPPVAEEAEQLITQPPASPGE